MITGSDCGGHSQSLTVTVSNRTNERSNDRSNDDDDDDDDDLQRSDDDDDDDDGRRRRRRRQRRWCFAGGLVGRAGRDGTDTARLCMRGEAVVC